MYRFLHNLTLRKKLFYGTAIVVFLAVIVTNSILYFVFRSNIEKDLEIRLSEANSAISNLIRTSASTAIRNRLRGVAEQNWDVVEYYNSLVGKGRMTLEEAKARATEVLLSQTIGTTGYIFCVDSNQVMLVHPKHSMVGRQLSKHPLSPDQGQKREGYLEYEWSNPGEGPPRPKALYMTYFEPWDWIISASAYRDEFVDLVPLEEIRRGVLDYTFGETGYAYVLDFSGNILIHPKTVGINPEKVGGYIDPKYFQEVLERRNGILFYSIRPEGKEDFREKIAIFSEIPELGWFVFSSGFLDEFQRPLRVMFYGMGGATVFILVVVFILTWWYGGMMTRPLPDVMAALERGAQGDLSQRVDENRGDEFGQLAKYYNQFMDSLERSRQQLADSERKYRDIFQQSVEGMFRAHTEAGFLEVNPAMAEIFGYADPEQVLREMTDTGTELYASASDRDLIRGLLTHNDYVENVTVRFKRRDGSAFTAAFSARVERNDDGSVGYVDGSIRDITAQREFVEALTKAKEEAEAASRLKSDFLSLVSHELRTPMTSIQGFAHLVTKHLVSKVAPALDLRDHVAHGALKRATDNLNIIAMEIKRLARLIDEVGELVELDSGGSTFTPVPIDPTGPALVVRQAALAEASAKGLALKLHLDENLPLVIADSERIRQALGLLLDNAIKFTEEGEISMAVQRVDEGVEYSVRDTGPGIPDAFLENIFNQFIQLGDKLTDKPQGMGLGLTICHRIVTMHSGRIWAESAPDRGSIFSFTLPAKEG